MRNVELFIGNTRIDFFKDESISLTDSINNVKDISKVFVPFTQTFNVPASVTNNLIFKHYYNFDIDNGFDARFKADAILKLNGVDYKKGGVQLNAVDLENNKARSYKITFFGKTSELKEILGNADLAALTDLFQYKFIAQGTGDDTLRMFETGITTSGVVSTTLENCNVIYPFISLKDYFEFDNTNTIATPNFHNVSLFLELKAQLKPAIKIKRIIEAINNQYGINIQTADIGSKTSFFGSDVFNEMYLWCHRENTPTSPAETIPPTFGLNFDKVLEVKSLADLTYTAGAPDPLSAGGLLTIQQGDEFSIRWVVAKTSAPPVLVQLSAVDKITGELLFTDEKEITNINTTIVLQGLTSGELVERTYDIEFKFVAYSFVSIIANTADIIKNATAISNYSYSAFQLRAYGLIEDLIPKMKIIDFLAGLFRTFNLVAYQEGTDSTIYVQTFDDFMTGGTLRDITKFVDVKKSTTSRPIPYSRIEYEYGAAKDQMSKRYIDEFSRQFGNLDYSAPERYEGQNFKLQSPFGHFIYININDVNSTGYTDYLMGWAIDEKGEKPVIPAPLIFFRNNIDTSADPVTAQNLNTYNAPSNVSTDGNHTLNFGNEQNELTKEMVENGIFQRFWQQFITQSFKLKGRIIKVTAYLDNNFLLNYKLNDVIRIAGRDYYINSIKTNLTTGKSDLELIVKTITYQPSVLT